MSDPIYMRRKDAARLIERIRIILRGGEQEDDGRLPAPSDEHKLHAIHLVFQDARIPPLELCPGEAHSNPHIDNCGSCAPRWGLVGPEVKIR
jgi:hypothetical protein